MTGASPSLGPIAVSIGAFLEPLRSSLADAPPAGGASVRTAPAGALLFKAAAAVKHQRPLPEVSGNVGRRTAPFFNSLQ
jgi:hypothetical protein